MHQCPVLEYLELLAVITDEYIHNKVGIKVYEAQVKDLRQKIDEAVLKYCDLEKVV